MLAIIDYGMGNLKSVANALNFIGADFLVTNQAVDIKKADGIILPGVGAFGDGVANLCKLGLDIVLKEEITERKKKFLGICLGMQMLAEKGYEGGKFDGLGLIKGETRKLEAAQGGLKVPHVGWNDITFKKDCPLFYKILNNSDFYFVHSYSLVCQNKGNVLATCDYGGEFVAAAQKDNIFAVQFHPEKSQENGLQLLMNFVDL